MNTGKYQIRSLLPAVAVALGCVCGQAGAKGKEDPTSRTGHGQTVDRWVLKGTDTTAKCDGMVSVQTNAATKATSYSCRSGGGPIDIEPAPKADPKPRP